MKLWENGVVRWKEYILEKERGEGREKGEREGGRERDGERRKVERKGGRGEERVYCWRNFFLFGSKEFLDIFD